MYVNWLCANAVRPLVTLSFCMRILTFIDDSFAAYWMLFKAILIGILICDSDNTKISSHDILCISTGIKFII